MRAVTLTCPTCGGIYRCAAETWEQQRGEARCGDCFLEGRRGGPPLAGPPSLRVVPCAEANTSDR